MTASRNDTPEAETGALHLADDDATGRLGAALALRLAPGDCVTLAGGLGAGKTALARAAIRARLAAAGRPAEDIPSPTFTLVQIYEADVTLWHADLYRLSGEDEVYELGLDEAFTDAVTLIEWPCRLGALMPARRLETELCVAENGGRDLRWRAMGPGWRTIADLLRSFG